MITAHPHSDTHRKILALESEIKRMQSERSRNRLIVAAAEELLAAEQAVDELASLSCRGEVTGAVARRLAVVDRLRRAQKRMRELGGFVD